MKKKNNQAQAKIRVMLVDDHAGMREALRKIINLEQDLAVVAEADSGRSAIQLLRSTKPNVILMDGSMPKMNGIEATRRLTQLLPEVKIIGLTLYEESAYLEEMIAAGARGYLLKTGDARSVLRAIRAVAEGRTYFDKSVPRRASAATRARPSAEELNAEELAVIKRLANGQTNVEIAAELELTLPAVEGHRTAAMKKLNLRSRAELTRVAILHQWLDS